MGISSPQVEPHHASFLTLLSLLSIKEPPAQSSYNDFMRALRKPLWRKGLATWQVFVCLVVAAFLCRSVIPVGYMPGNAGGHHGSVALVLCTMGVGSGTLELDVSTSSSSDDDAASGEVCLFGVVVSQTLLPTPDAPVLVSKLTHRPASLSHGNRVLPPLPAQGPPLGSRAPPSNLG